MKIIFFGSDDFAVRNLEELLNNSSHEVVACVTQPDKAKGRGLQLSASPVKEAVAKHNIPVLQPPDIRDREFQKKLRGFEGDLFVVIAYGRILPEDILSLPRLFSINLHGSLLPKYRGAAPINWAIINGEQKTGVSIIKMNTAMDAGDIIAQAELNIDQDDTSATLRSKMADLGAAQLVKTIDNIAAGKCIFRKQEPEAVTQAPKLTKELGAIDWAKKAEDIHNLVRGLLPWPGAFTECNGKKLKILKTRVIDTDAESGKAGEVIAVSKEGFSVRAGDKAVLVCRVHPESSKEMDAQSFAVGHRIDIGFQF